jgi:hypothetical protein
MQIGFYSALAHLETPFNGFGRWLLLHRIDVAMVSASSSLSHGGAYYDITEQDCAVGVSSPIERG